MSGQGFDTSGLDGAAPPHRRALFEFALSRSPAVLYGGDLATQTSIRFIGPNVEALTGHAPSAFVEDPGHLVECIHPDDRAAYRDALARIEDTETLEIEYRLSGAAGGLLWIRDTLRRAEKGEDGRQFVGCMIDITAEMQARASLADSESLKGAIIKAARDAIIAIDEDGLVIEFSKQAEAMFGYRRSETLGRPVGELIVPETTRALHYEGLRRLKETGVATILNTRPRLDAMRADGSLFPAEIIIVQAQLAGRPAYVAEIRDISGQVAAEEEHQRTAVLLRDAVESLPNGFSIYDREDRLVLANSALCKAYGVDPESMRGSRREDVVAMFLPQIRTFDGIELGDPEESVALVAGRLRALGDAAIEIEMHGGAWRLLTSQATSEGGQVVISTDITRLKQAEASLRDSEEQFRSIVVGNPSPVRVTDAETWEILYESPAAAALFGRPWPSPGVRSTVETYVDMKAREELVRNLKSNGRIDNHEVMMRRADGTTFWVEMSARVIRYHGKDVCVTSLVDLTETKAREAELRQARETLEDAIESLSEGLVLYDADNRLVLCNSQYRSYHEGSEDLLETGAFWPDVTRKRAERGLFVSARGQIEAWLEGQMAQRGIASNEVFAWSDGRWFEYSHRPTRQGGFVSTWRDITERKKMEQTLRDSEEMVRQVLEACPVPITMNRADDGVIIYESPAARALMRYTEPREGRTVLSRWVKPEDRRDYLERLRRTGAVDGMEMPSRKADGEEFWCALSARLIDYRGEKVIVSNIFDLTERRTSEAELARQRELLHQSEKLSALGEVLAGVAHELNNPLSVLVGQALMLEEAAEDEQVARRAEKIRNAANRCARIVKTFLSMARRQATEYKRVDVNQVVEAALEVTGYSLRAAGIDVSLRLAKSLPQVMADDHQLQQVVTNLMINAQHALEEVEGRRRLRIATSFRRRTGQVVLKIKDNGPGIPEDIRARIFEPLFTTKAIGAGTGLGLALCHRLIEAHKGTIEIEGGAGEGAVFAIRLPAAEAEAEIVSQAAAPAADPKTYRILVVDDEPDVAEFLADVLEIDGHRVAVAVTGKEMLERLEGGTFDVVLSDIRMPEIDGPSLYRILGERWPSLVRRLAFVTGDTLSAKVTEFLDKSGRPYIEKPITPKDVRQLIARVLDEGGTGGRR